MATFSLTKLSVDTKKRRERERENTFALVKEERVAQVQVDADAKCSTILGGNSNRSYTG